MLNRYFQPTRNTRRLSHLRELCDVPGCPGWGQRMELGSLCSKHAEHFEKDLGAHAVFTTEVFLDAVTAEDDQRAREECYSRWLGKVAQATTRD